MGAFPGRDFRMVAIVRYVSDGKQFDLKGRRALRKALLRVLDTLEESGSVLVRPPRASRGGYALYQWRVR